MSVMMGRRMYAVIAVLLVTASPAAWAIKNLRITIPSRSELTPVQRLNREGVEAIRKQHFNKAATLFYKAYLFDPADPFTLNNLGYISELQGELERAQRFYSLAAAQGSNATIDRSNAKQLEGKPMQFAVDNLQDVPMRVNRMNVEAMYLLAKNRGFEAVALLRKALALNAQNPFTLNNLGVAEETIGDYDSALKSYTLAADVHSSQSAAVTQDRAWRGKSVSVMAAASAQRLTERMEKLESAKRNAVMLTLRGISATNQNEWQAARKDFLQAYSLDPSSAFTLNNRGYVAEMDGDLESAQDFYQKARKASGSNERIGLATQSSAEGQVLSKVADTSNVVVGNKLEIYSQERRRQTGPIVLTPRGNETGGDSSAPPAKPSSPNLPLPR
ncbi:MAG TPA: tetratricopeptide repeat protein [Terracidiphilus sp.]|nr:tetratricopeptide repeat protein [Terracidiphilus sp.]